MARNRGRLEWEDHTGMVEKERGKGGNMGGIIRIKSHLRGCMETYHRRSRNRITKSGGDKTPTRHPSSPNETSCTRNGLHQIHLFAKGVL